MTSKPKDSRSVLCYTVGYCSSATGGSETTILDQMWYGKEYQLLLLFHLPPRVSLLLLLLLLLSCLSLLLPFLPFSSVFSPASSHLAPLKMYVETFYCLFASAWSPERSNYLVVRSRNSWSFSFHGKPSMYRILRCSVNPADVIFSLAILLLKSSVYLLTLQFYVLIVRSSAITVSLSTSNSAINLLLISFQVQAYLSWSAK